MSQCAGFDLSLIGWGLFCAYKIDPNIRSQRIDQINIRWGQLHSLQREWSERAIRYLMLTNSGGAIATLSFIGASQLTFTECTTIFALLCFVSGVLLVGISTARTYHSISDLFESYTSDVNKYFSDKKSWEELCIDDNERSKWNILDYVIPYTSFGCFISGCLLVACSLFAGI